jgi:peptidoglycan hydrolase-like protein with peptidoglycan-binding domain
MSTAGAAEATWYKRSDYPEPKMAYVSHPAGFSDSTMVKKVGSGLSCNVPLAPAKIPGVTVQVRKELAPLVQELMTRTEAMGYDIGKNTWGYNCRFIRGSSTTPSNHAYGRAVDINSESNPMQSTFKSNIPPAVVKMWINHGFYWGGHYKSRPDAMHFEYVGTFANIGTYYKALTGQTVPTPPTPPKPPVATCPSATLASYPTLKNKSTGTAVKVAQCALGVTSDGIFGSATHTAVVNFQRSKGLTADGIIGPKTWAALLSKGSQPTLKQGAKSGDVTRLQRSLRARGHTIAVDGVFGAGTASVVKAYQRQAGLVADGIVGAKTWTALQSGR